MFASVNSKHSLMKKSLSFVFLFILFLTACSNDGINVIPDTTLNGKIFGEKFVATQGYAEVHEAQYIKIVLTAAEVSCGSEMHNLPLYLSLAVPDRIGFHKNVLAVFGKSGEEPEKEIDALVELIEVNQNQVTGKLRSENSGRNTVEGTFTVSRCMQ